jgi:hypothetical protein
MGYLSIVFHPLCFSWISGRVFLLSFTVQQALVVPNANRQMNWIQRLKLIGTTRYRLVVWVVPHRWKGKVVFSHRKFWELDRIDVFPLQMARCVPSPPLCNLGWPSPPWCRPHPQMGRTKTRTHGGHRQWSRPTLTLWAICLSERWRVVPMLAMARSSSVEAVSSLHRGGLLRDGCRLMPSSKAQGLRRDLQMAT